MGKSLWVIGSWQAANSGYYPTAPSNAASPKDINFVYCGGDKEWAEEQVAAFVRARGIKLPYTLWEAPKHEDNNSYHKVYSGYSSRVAGGDYLSRASATECNISYMAIEVFDELRKNQSDADYALNDVRSFLGCSPSYRSYSTSSPVNDFHAGLIASTAAKMTAYLAKKSKIRQAFMSKGNKVGDFFLTIIQNWAALQKIETWKEILGNIDRIDEIRSVEWSVSASGITYQLNAADGEEIDEDNLSITKFTTAVKELKQTMADKPTNPASTSLTDRISAAASDRAKQAAVRIGAKQLSRTVRGPLVLALASRMGGDEDANLRARSLLESDLGGAMMDILLSAMISGASALPLNGLPREHLDALAVELQIGAMADAGNTVAEIVMGPIRGALDTVTMAALPSGQETPALAAGSAAPVSVDFSKAQTVEVKPKKRG